ncbi:MAG: hypothetical protein PHY28_05620 [Dehalococcoidales bacterium]|nr:hypothetical protein [Dehalococcoidales bacterium]
MADTQLKAENPAANNKGEPSKTTDAMFNLFAASVVEESGLGKFAARLKDIDVQDILKDARWLNDRLKGIKE